MNTKTSSTKYKNKCPELLRLFVLWVHKHNYHVLTKNL